MKKFCRSLRPSQREKFNIEVSIFVSKKKNSVHMSFQKQLVSYENFKSIIEYIRYY